MSGDHHVRIGTAEREEAMALLGNQFSEGRLNPDEFCERSAAISAAVTRADLQPIFADLPVVLPLSGPWADRLAAAQATAAAQIAARRARTERDHYLATTFSRLVTITRFAAVASVAMIFVSSIYHSSGSGQWLILTGYGWMIASAFFSLPLSLLLL